MTEYAIKSTGGTDEETSMFRFPDSGNLVIQTHAERRGESLTAIVESTLMRGVGQRVLEHVVVAARHCAERMDDSVNGGAVPLLIALAMRDEQSVAELRSRVGSGVDVVEGLEDFRAVGLATSHDLHGLEVYSLAPESAIPHP